MFPTILKKHFLNFRIDKIEYLLQPERQTMRGCFYSFAKFFIAMIVFSISLNTMYALTPLDTLLITNTNTYITAPLFILLFSIAVIPPILAINILDGLWRRKEKSEHAYNEIEIAPILKNYKETKAINKYNKEVIERLLQENGNINEKLETMRGKQLALIEDAILYSFETNGIQHAHAYGLKLIILSFIIVFFLTFVPLFILLEDLLREYFRAFSNSIAVIFLFFPVAIFASWRAITRSFFYWEKVGPHGRNFARNLIFYWPITLISMLIFYAYTLNLWGLLTTS